jgi:hypothetical protein
VLRLITPNPECSCLGERKQTRRGRGQARSRVLYTFSTISRGKATLLLSLTHGKRIIWRSLDSRLKSLLSICFEQNVERRIMRPCVIISRLSCTTSNPDSYHAAIPSLEPLPHLPNPSIFSMLLTSSIWHRTPAFGSGKNLWMRLSFVLDTVENPRHTDRLVPTWMERDATLEMQVGLHTSSPKRPPFASLSSVDPKPNLRSWEAKPRFDELCSLIGVRVWNVAESNSGIMEATPSSRTLPLKLLVVWATFPCTYCIYIYVSHVREKKQNPFSFSFYLRFS